MEFQICFDIGGFWIAWFPCRCVVKMKTRESNLSVTHDTASHSATPAKRSFSAPLQGRRIVHLRYLAAGLSACQNAGCGKPLALIDCVEERRYSLGSVLVIISPCQQCGIDNFMLNTLASVLPQATPKLLWVSVFFNLIRFIHDNYLRVISTLWLWKILKKFHELVVV